MTKPKNYRTLKIAFAMTTLLASTQCFAEELLLVKELSSQAKNIIQSGFNQADSVVSAASLLSTVAVSSVAYFKSRELIDSIKTGSLVGGVLFIATKMGVKILASA